MPYQDGRISHPQPKCLISRDCSTVTGANPRIVRREQEESTPDPLNDDELAPNSANGSIPSLIAWTEPKPPGNAAPVSRFRDIVDASGFPRLTGQVALWNISRRPIQCQVGSSHFVIRYRLREANDFAVSKNGLRERRAGAALR